MIITASKKTDIPALYGDWFMNRIRDRFVDINKNQMRPKLQPKLLRYELSPKVVDLIMFYTRDPSRFIKHLDELSKRGFLYMFKYAINPYDMLIEPKLTNKHQLISSFKEISNKIGRDRIEWVYDPIILTPQMTLSDHKKLFENMAGILGEYTESVRITTTQPVIELKVARYIGQTAMSLDEKIELLGHFAKTAEQNGIQAVCCSKEKELEAIGLNPRPCIDPDAICKLQNAVSHSFTINEESRCQSAAAIDIGYENTCTQGCQYCRHKSMFASVPHDCESTSLLASKTTTQKTVKVKQESNLIRQFGLFETG